MRSTRYSRWTFLDWDDVALSELMEELSDHLLESGFQEELKRQMARWSGAEFEEGGAEDALESLREAIRNALRDSNLLTEEQHRQLFNEQGQANNEELSRLIEQLIARLLTEGFLSLQSADGTVDWYMENDEDGNPRRVRVKPSEREGQTSEYRPPQIRIEVTQKGTDFLGYKSLQYLLGSLGRASFGRHETDRLTTGVELAGSSKPYEFGDTMNLDVARSLLSAAGRSGPGGVLDIDYSDLYVEQAEYHSSCATVLMLDCSHSMILYGEDRFTPAKKVALALSHLIRTQYPGDSLHLVLFHDGAEEFPLSKLASLTVGPYHTNTAEGLKLARRILLRQPKEMRQIIMITDGKPSALFLDEQMLSPKARKEGAGRRLYKNPMGLDPVIISHTLKEAAECRRYGILINTFMLTDDYYLVEFVKQLTQIASGKAYFTSSLELGEYVMMDFMKRRVQKVR